MFPEDDWMLFDPFRDVFNYYKRNLYRFTRIIRRQEFAKLIRPGQFDTEPPNNLDKIMNYAEANFGGIVNSTKDK